MTGDVIRLPIAPEPSVTEPLLLRPNEVAALLGVSRSRVYELANAGAIPSLRLGGSLRIPRSRLVSWIEERTAEGSASPAVRTREARTSGQLAT